MMGLRNWRLLTIVTLAFLASATARPEDAAKNQPFAVKVVGKGKPMILIPGLACSGDVWDATVDHFKGKYECHVLTLAGFAGQQPVSGPFLETMHKGIVDYIRSHKLEKPVIVGHSLGGYLVFDLGETEPHLPGALIAVDGLPCLAAAFAENVSAEGLKKLSSAMQKRLESLPKEQYLTQSKMMINSWITDGSKRELVGKWGEQSDQATVAKATGELLGKDLRPQTDRIEAPLLLLGAWTKEMEALGATRDVVTKRYESQVAKVPHHKVAMAENAKHFLMFDAPQWMLTEMDAFLADK
jgi:pimeloyl-ACP methyl ester carboxylesterase